MRTAIALAAPVVATDHAIGPLQALVTLVEYGDYECPNCKQAAPVIKLLLSDFMGRLRFVFRHFPLEEVHPHALLAAQAAEAAAGQGVFWPMHEILFDHMHALKARHLREYAQRLELDLPRFTSDLGDNIYLPRIRAHQRGGVASGVRAVPTFFVNGALFDVSFGIQPLFDAVEEACGQEVERTVSMR